jgi:hypothetical protein
MNEGDNEAGQIMKMVAKFMPLCLIQARGKLDL